MIATRASRRLHRWLVGILAMVLVGLLAPTGAARAAGPGVPIPPDIGLTGQGTGAVSAADRDFVIKVRLAGLWAIPAGNLAVEKSDDPKIVNIGKAIAAQHVVLDNIDRDVAKKLGIELPNQPNSDQQGWLAEMENATSATQFDQIYIDRLRAAQGEVFPAIATIRTSTRNDSIRKLAQDANQFVLTHITLLESSGIVDYGSLPTAAAPAPPKGKGPLPMVNQLLAAADRGTGGPGVITTLIVFVGALVTGLITTMRIFRSR